MCIDTREQRRMKMVYNLTQKFSSVIEDPRVVGIIKECGGKMYMSEKRWEAALEEFRASFQCMVESGNPRAVTMLKYLILTSLLSQTEVDFLGTREAKVYAQNAEIIGMTNLKLGFENNNVDQIQKILADKSINLLSDPFIATYLDDLLRTVRLNALQQVCAPYKSVKLDFLAEKMNVDLNEIRSLLSELILEEKLEGQIDQLNGYLELRSREGQIAQKHRVMQIWGDKLLDIHKQLIKKVNHKTGESQDDLGMFSH